MGSTPPPQAPGPFTDKGVEKRREILAGASRVFRRRGLASTGMRDIAAELGMAVGNLYYYFDSKEALLAYCQEDALSGLLELAARVRRLDLAADGRLYLLVVGHVVRLNLVTPGSLAHLEVEALSEPRRDAIRTKRRAYQAEMRSLIEEGVEQGVFRRCDSKVAAMALLGAANWTVKWFDPAGPRSAREIGEELAALLVRGLLARGRELEAPPPEVISTTAEAPGAAPAPAPTASSPDA